MEPVNQLEWNDMQPYKNAFTSTFNHVKMILTLFNSYTKFAPDDLEN